MILLTKEDGISAGCTSNLRTIGKNDFAEGFKILLDTDLKIILLGHQNNFVRILKIMNNAARKILIF